MTVSEIVARLEAIERLWREDQDSPQKRAVERLRLDIEMALLRASA